MGVSEPGLLKWSCLCPGGDCKWDVNRSSFVWMAFSPRERNFLTVLVFKADLLLLLRKFFSPTAWTISPEWVTRWDGDFLPRLAKHWVSHLHLEGKLLRSFLGFSSARAFLDRHVGLSCQQPVPPGRGQPGRAVFLTPCKTSGCFAHFFFFNSERERDKHNFLL